ncbi:undecaprenyl-phosphate glucose phosphotransferase [bacterium]|nr:undecaprenyl-phosphate glucose phosphotransferase [bacterium]
MHSGKDRYCLPLLILVAADAAVFFTSILAAYQLRFGSPIADLIHPLDPQPNYLMYLRLAAWSTLLGLFVFYYSGFYRRRDGMVRQTRPVFLVLGVLVSYIFLMCLLFWYRGFSYSRLTVALSAVWCSGAILVASYALRGVQAWMIARGIGFRKTLLVVDEAGCASVIARLRSNHGSQYQIVGCVATNGYVGRQMAGLPVLGRASRLGRILKRTRVDCVIVATRKEHAANILDLARTCQTFSATCCYIPDVYEQVARQMDVGEEGPLPIVTIGETPLAGGNRLLKDAMDFVIASLVLAILAVPMLLIALIVKLDSRGPVFYRQARLSSSGRVFYIYKFRSMREDAENPNAPVWASRDDPRCTRVGRLIRKLNLDELPQLFNVLRGEMSLVGPRPERPYFINQFKTDIPAYMRRYLVKPGITGWAQVNGLRGDTSVEQRIRYDMYYIENWSLLLDLVILLRTPFAFTNAH